MKTLIVIALMALAPALAHAQFVQYEPQHCHFADTDDSKPSGGCNRAVIRPATFETYFGVEETNPGSHCGNSWSVFYDSTQIEPLLSLSPIDGTNSPGILLLPFDSAVNPPNVPGHVGCPECDRRLQVLWQYTTDPGPTPDVQAGSAEIQMIWQAVNPGTFTTRIHAGQAARLFYDGTPCSQQIPQVQFDGASGDDLIVAVPEPIMATGLWAGVVALLLLAGAGTVSAQETDVDAIMDDAQACYDEFPDDDEALNDCVREVLEGAVDERWPEWPEEEV